MARPRTITDERMLSAAGVVIGRLGPGFTLRDVAVEARVAVGSVSGRFGSKHGLLVAMTRAAIASLPAVMRAEGDVLTALVAAYAPLDDPAVAANNLAQLGVDLGDARLRALMAEFHAVMEAEVRRLLDRAPLAHGPPSPVAARILTAVADGTAVHWSARPVGGLRERLRDDLDAIITAWKGTTA